MPLKFVSCPSPNHDARTAGVPVDILVLHYTGMKTADEALARLCDPAAKVSAHYTIDRDGRVYTHVPEDRRAWHAGVSWWGGATDINARSIGIELVNPGHEFGYVDFTESQIASLIELAKGILARHPIPPRRVLGHSDVAPHRKMDPGERFPWQGLADAGIGEFPAPRLRANLPDEQWEKSAALDPRDLSTFGYAYPGADMPFAASPTSIISAFQRHFRPWNVDGNWDYECGVTLRELLAMRGPG